MLPFRALEYFKKGEPMMSRCLVIVGLALVCSFTFDTTVSACESSTGLSIEDKGIARRVCAELKASGEENVTKVTVRRTTMTLQVTEPYYLGLMENRPQAETLLSGWAARFMGETGKRMVTVNVDYDGDKVIEVKRDQVGNLDFEFAEEKEE